MNHKPYLKEIVILVMCFAWLLFVATNVNIQLGQTYLQFTAGCLILLIIGVTIFDKNLHITFQKQPGGNLKAIMIGFAGWIALLIASIITLRFIDPSKANVASIIGLLGATTPALATSKIANLITFGGAVAFIETQLWARMMEFMSDLFGIQLNRKNLLTIGVITIIGVLSFAFLMFHLTAKGITNAPALIIVFIMMAISLGMVVIFGETRQAVYLHIIANSVASYLMLFATSFINI